VILLKRCVLCLVVIVASAESDTLNGRWFNVDGT
jgi:hypothetical protein